MASNPAEALGYAGSALMGMGIATPAVGVGEAAELFGVEAAESGANAFSDLSTFRSELGLPEGQGTLARLHVGGQSFYGINAHGQPLSLSVNAISATHAEADVFQQAINAGITEGEGVLTVDRDLCLARGQNGAVNSMARQVGISPLTIQTPKRNNDNCAVR
jgi:hypothetical protein